LQHYLGRLGRSFFACETRASIIRKRFRQAVADAVSNLNGSGATDDFGIASS
jgi:hypothetical protein